ncbi:RHS repeat-associated core domain-containing protein [Chryseobacterium sp. JM1]|uniref:RHS repeat-associated core domain-containing protein n=1 Tax=Chryseobacterium sp. JM1 TaxID=1233950 RepID=UPI0004E61C05|nr:SpvB/TcaC N-terminal domain-containing protein [Chryseobacterium sp. JM1]KFF23048.1 type IV secretion protein Rhs [Chryseobacterium sp. JM1]
MKFYNNKKRLLFSFVLLLISMVGFAQIPPVQKLHATKGNVEVNGAGQLQFALPVAIPPGVKNVEPQVNLVYTSGSSNGIAGYGWNISGISSISRTGKNIERDREVKGVQMDESDSYNFGGQRLVLKSGEYGQDGAQYVTEKFSNTIIKSIGSITGQTWKGPEYWEVTFADGAQAWYGGSNATGSNSATTPLEYNIVKWKDPQGNYITYDYTQGTGTNVAVISSIKWGGNEALGKPHFNEIIFNYNLTTAREVKEQSFVRGISFLQDKLLNSITVKTHESQYRKYDIIYKTDHTKYQFVEKIQEYNSENQPAHPVEFFRNELQPTNSYVFDADWSRFYNVSLSGDFRGTHSADFIVYKDADGRDPAGYYLYYTYEDLPQYYLGTENVFQNAVPIDIKDGSNVVRSRQGIVSYQVNPTSRDLTLNYYLIDLAKPIVSQSFPNALYLAATKVIPRSEWDESESNFSNPSDTYQKTSEIIKLIPYDMDGDGVSEVLIAKNNSITNRICTVPENQFPTEDDCQSYTYDESKYIAIKQQDNSFSFFQFDFDKNLIFGDFNGDGIDDMGKSNSIHYTTINGESVPGNILQAYNLKKNAQGSLSLSEVFSADYSGVSSQVQVGDFNGDGISDLFVLTEVNNHYIINLNTGKSFLKTPYFNDFNGTYSLTTSQYGNYSTARVLDINSDGKSDIINFGTHYNILSPTSANSSLIIKVSENQGYLDGKIKFGDNPAVTRNYNIPYIFREIIGLRQNQLSVYSPSNNQYIGRVTFFTHYANLQKSPISKIIQGGIGTLISYDGSDSYRGHYKPIKNEQYPLMELENVNSQLVSRIYESSYNGSRHKTFRYRGLMINLHNKKTVGFRQMASSSWYALGFENTIIWSGTETDPLQEGAPVKEWSIRTNDNSKIFPQDISENNTQLLSFKSTEYQYDKLLNGQIVTSVSDADRDKIVTVILPKTTKAKDFLTGATAENTVTYGHYYLPSQSISKINLSYAVTTSHYQYNNNPSGTGPDYYIGRLKYKAETIQAYGDTKSTQKEFFYENNLVKTTKDWNRDNTGYIKDTFTYDGFGNITQKVSANTVDAGTISSAYQYDPKGRFVVKQTDNLGLQTEILYNNWGQITNKTDPFNNTITNTYDSWGKVLTSTSSVSGTTSYGYERDNQSNVVITQNDPDGNISKKFTNVREQDYKTSTKAFGQGQFISKETQFDVLGRKLKESEPYFEGQSPGPWNTIAYDDSVYPAKITATSFNGKQTQTTVSGLITTVEEINGNKRTNTKTADALGNVIATTDKGGTIQFSYNAAGDQIQAKYAESTVSTKYDSWGRKSEFNDPSNGVYKYEYDGFGRAKKTISPKGQKEYTYNNFGQLVTQKEISTIDAGQTTNKTISLSYNDKGLLTAKSGIIKGQNFSVALTYDSQGRLLSSTENSNGRTYRQKGMVYDGKGRISSYEKELQGGVTTKVAIENVYSAWNGELYQIKDKNSGKILWELKETNAKGQALKSKLGAADITNTFDANGFLSTLNHSSAVKPKILQIIYSFDAIKNELKTRKTEGDFDMNESFDYDSNNRLINWTNPVTGIKPPANRNVYDIKGRITQNDQVGTIKFDNSAKIYQPTGMTLNAQGTQNYNGDLIQTITYNENNDPVQISGEKTRINFEYGLGNMRQRIDISELKQSMGPGKPQLIWQNTLTKLYSEDASFEIAIDLINLKEKHTLYIGGSPYESDIVYLKDFGQSSGSYKFLHKDYLGSILAISDEAGNRIEQRHYDAWGNLAAMVLGNSGAVITGKSAIAETSLLVDRGYTIHEHFAKVGIIHMNGRLYDPLLRRFLNADENIQDPANTQNYNKYGYVMNNPMMYNDPTGEFWAWFIGSLVGSYFSGVQANHGNFNPVKWDWKNTWTAVVGGAFARAAIGQGVSNINVYGTKFIANSVIGSVGSIFNGIATGQNIFKSALIGFSGINYTFNLSSNNPINAGYEYSISEMLVNDDNTLIGGTEAVFSRDTVLKVANAHYKNQFIRGSWHFVDQTSDLSPYIRGQGYSLGGSSNENLLVNGEKRIWGLTEIVRHNNVIVWQRIYLPKGAFISLEQLDLTMGHEIFHSILNNARLFDDYTLDGLNRKSSVHEYYTSRWEEQYIKFRGWQKLNLNMESFNNGVWGVKNLEGLMNKIKPIYNNYLKSTLK